MMNDKSRELHGLAVRLLDYIELCNRENIVPLRHDINVFNNELIQIERSGK